MTALIDPTTDRTFTHAKLLSMLMDWSTEKRILAALLRARRASPGGLAQMAQRIQVTREARGQAGLSEAQLANYLLVFVADRNVRRVIAGYMSSAHQVPKRQAVRDLWELRKELLDLARVDRPRIQLVGG